MQIKGIFGKGRRNTGRKELRGSSANASSDQKPVDDDHRPKKRKLTKIHAPVEDENEAEGPDAYTALLTLLKSSADHGLSKASSADNSSAIRDHGDEEDEEEVEGAYLESDEEQGESEEEGQGEKEDEQEEEEETEIYREIQLDDNIEESKTDPFFWHFSHVDQDILDGATRQEPVAMTNTKMDILGQKSVVSRARYVAEHDSPLNQMPTAVASTTLLPLKHRLKAPFQRANPQWTQLQSEFSGALFNYQDILYPYFGVNNSEELQRVCALHALNHVYKARDVILRNNNELDSRRQQSIKRAVVESDEEDDKKEDNDKIEVEQDNEQEEENEEKEKEEEEEEEEEEDEDDKFRDQGFTRPRVLILVPTRNAAYEFVQQLMSISGLKQIENKKRFKSAFFDDFKIPEYRPADFRQLFKGNSNDMFCLGVRFTAQSMRLYASFYASDIIVASPLGLRMIVTSSAKNKQDYDFLSSIEVALVAGADAMQMQSWENVQLVFKHMNLVPKEQHDCDFSRLRMPFIEEKMKFLRQTIILSQYRTPEINSLFQRQCCNIGGKIRARMEYKGVLGLLGFRVKQTFTRIPRSSTTADPTQDPELRFKYFTSVVLPSILRGATAEGTLIYVPSYIDFVRIRNYFDDQNIPGKCISEYSSNSDITRARALFGSGRLQMLVYTERLHHFRRYDLKGVKQIVMYGAPENPEFYKEVVRFFLKNPDLNEAHGGVRVLYSKWDSLKLERIVGTSRVAALLSENEAYEFY